MILLFQISFFVWSEQNNSAIPKGLNLRSILQYVVEATQMCLLYSVTRKVCRFFFITNFNIVKFAFNTSSIDCIIKFVLYLYITWTVFVLPMQFSFVHCRALKPEISSARSEANLKRNETVGIEQIVSGCSLGATSINDILHES